MNKIKLILIILSIVGSTAGVFFVKRVFEKSNERDQFAKENEALAASNKAYKDSLLLSRELLAKSMLDTKNAGELYAIMKGTTQDFQRVIMVMRDSVIKINKDRVKLETEVLELQKDLERARKKRKFL